MSLKRKIIIGFSSFFVVLISSGLFLLYGPWDGFRDLLITTAMTTMNHKYLATWFYSDKTINEVLTKNGVIEVNEITDTNLIKFKKYTTTIYKNEYEKELLTREEGNDLYKLINLSGPGYQGFLVAIYQPSRVKIATSKYVDKNRQDAVISAPRIKKKEKS